MFNAFLMGDLKKYEQKSDRVKALAYFIGYFFVLVLCGVPALVFSDHHPASRRAVTLATAFVSIGTVLLVSSLFFHAKHIRSVPRLPGPLFSLQGFLEPIPAIVVAAVIILIGMRVFHWPGVFTFMFAYFPSMLIVMAVREWRKYRAETMANRQN